MDIIRSIHTMAFFKVSTSVEAVRDTQNFNTINKSGIYEISIKHVLYNKSPNGSEVLDINFDYAGTNQTIWQAIRLTNNDGSPNLENNLFNKLCIVAGATDGMEISDPEPVELTITRETKQYQELMDLRDTDVLVRIQLEYSKYDGKIREKKGIKNFFRIGDKATAAEIVNNSEPGKQYEEELKLADKITYRDGLIFEDIDEWKKQKAEEKKEAKKEAAEVKGFKRPSFKRNAA